MARKRLTSSRKGYGPARTGAVLGFLLVLWLPAASVQALPEGAQVVAGDVTFESRGEALDVLQTSDKAIVNYDDFSIALGEIVQFNQPGPDAAVLNRVPAGPVSLIEGQLIANGRVFLVNPSGVVFAGTAQVSVRSLVASALDIPDADFLNENYAFQGGPGSGAIENAGQIQADAGGEVFLIGLAVQNSGTVEAPGGSVGLAAGSEAFLTDDPFGHLVVQLQTWDGQVDNTGDVQALGGRAAMYGAAVNHDGLMTADDIVVRAEGPVGVGGGMTAQLGDLSVEGTEIAFQDGAAVANTGDGGISLVATAGDVSVTGVAARQGVSVQAAGAVSDAGESATDISAGETELVAGLGIGTPSDALEVDAAKMAAASETGGIYVDDVEGGLELADVGNTSGVSILTGLQGDGISISASGPLVATADVVNVGGGWVSLEAGDYGATEPDPEANLTLSGKVIVSGGTGSVDLLAAGDILQTGEVVAGSSDVQLAARGTVNVGGPVSTQAGALGVDGGGVAVGTSGSLTNSGPGIIQVTSAEDISNAGSILAAEGEVWLEAPGGEIAVSGGVIAESAAIWLMGRDLTIDGSLAANGQMGRVSLSAENSITHNGEALAGAMGVRMETFGHLSMAGTVSTQEGSILLTAADMVIGANGSIVASEGGEILLAATVGDMAVTGVSGDALVSAAAAGAVYDGGEVVADLVGPEVQLTAGAGIGTSEDRLEIDAGTLAAQTASGGLHVADISGGLVVGAVGAMLGASILGGNPGDLYIAAFSPLTISEDVSNLSGGSIILAAEGAYPGDDLTVAANVVASGGDGSIKLFAGSDIIQAGNVVAEGGSILLSARDRISLSGTISTQGGDVTILATSLHTGPGASVQVPGGNIIVTLFGPVSSSVSAQADAAADLMALLESSLGPVAAAEETEEREEEQAEQG